MAMCLQAELFKVIMNSGSLTTESTMRKSIWTEPKELFLEYGNQIAWIYLRQNGQLCQEKGQTLGSENDNSSWYSHMDVI